MKIIKTILCVLFGLMFINAGLDKFFHYMPMPEMKPEDMKIFEAIVTLKWLIPLVAVIELLGGLLFIFPKTRALGAIVILPLTVGILLHNFTFTTEGPGLAIAGVLFLINVWMIGDNWNKYKPMFN